MWTLECEGPYLENKRIWLRPGKGYLFGRTLPPKGRLAGFKIDEKSVSRQHMTIQVSKVTSGDGSRVNTSSEITFTDLGTKFGTVINGDRLTNATRVLKSDIEHAFVLGNTKHKFWIKWLPIVLSFSFSSKDSKGGKDPLQATQSRLEDLDIKSILPYVNGKTTHVVSSKRNTAKGLQALIDGKHIVDDSFIDALIFATTPGDLDEPESLCLLEEDFDANWPDELDHLPAKSKEPNERPKEFFRPNPERISIFEGYTFIFFDQVQFDTLQAPVHGGRGEALYFPLELGKTSADELIRYVKNAAEEKGLGEFEDGSEGKGVVLVRFRGKRGFEEWATQLGDQLAVAVDQRMIEQSEFMDAILENSASKLRRPLPEEEQDATSTGPLAARNDEQEERLAQPESGQTISKRGRTRGLIKARFKGFDDESDDDDDTKSSSLHNGDHNIQARSASRLGKSQRARPPNTQAESLMDAESHDTETSTVPLQKSRKRRATEMDDENEEEFMDQILPAAAAMKRRKVEEQEEALRNGVSAKPPAKSQQEQAPLKKTKAKKEVNIQEVVREHREAEEDAVRKEEESLRVSLDGMKVDDMKHLAVVEEMDLPDRSEERLRSRADGTSNSSRLNDAWNGRKNFKKFRRRGDDGAPPRRGHSVIVPLEEVRKKDFGIGEGYWLENDKSKKKRKGKDRVPQDTSTPPEPTARSQAEPELELDTEEDSMPVPVPVPAELHVEDNDPDTVDISAPRLTRHQQQANQDPPASGISSSKSQSKSQSQSQPGPRTAAVGAGNRRKRAASPTTANPSLGAGAPAAKKARLFTTALPEENEMATAGSQSDSEDELKFRFRVRKKM